RKQDDGWVATDSHVAVKVDDLVEAKQPAQAPTARHPGGLERRTMAVGEVRTVPETEAAGKNQFWARVIAWNALDDYNTTFAPGCFDGSLGVRMPRYLYGHAGWSLLANVIGRGVDWRSGPEGLDVMFEL